MANNFMREIVPLSRFGVLVAQLESIVASAAHKPPDALLCFDLLSDLVSAIDDEPKESLLLWQRKCEDALYNLLVLGARRPVRHLASVAMARVIAKGDGISIYSRASSLQGFLSDGKRSEPLRVAGAAQCLGELYRFFGRRITSGLRETTIIVTKLMKFNEDFVRQEALHMLQNALEGSGGSAASSAYTDAYRLVMRLAVGDKSFIVRIAAAKCLKAFANIGGPGLGAGELENSANHCVKALEDPIPSVRDAFSEALGAVLALGMNPEAQVQPRGKSQIAPKKFEGGLQKHLVLPFMRASGFRSRDIRVGLTLSWVFFLQAIRLKYLHPDSELQSYALQVMEMLRMDSSSDAQALACVLYVLRVGVTDQMTEPTQRSFLVFLGKQLQSSDTSSSMKIAAFRTLSYALKTLGEVPLEFKEVLDSTIVAALSHSTPLVRVEAALTLRALAEVEPTCVGGLISYGITTLSALRENVKFEKGSNLQTELDSLHGQSTVLAALVSILPKLHLGYPARLPKSVLEVSKKMLMESSGGNPVAATAEKEAGWLLVSSLLASMAKEELEDQVFDILSLWAALFTGNLDNKVKQSEDLTFMIRVWSAAMDALAEFIRCFITTNSVNKGILLQPVLLYLSRALSCISSIAAKEQKNVKSALDLFTIRTLIAYSSLSDPMAYKGDHSQILQICTTPFRDASVCEESSCLRILLDKRDAWLGPWIPGRDWLEDELRAFQGGKDGDLPCVWEAELSSFPQPENISSMLVNQKLLCFGTMFSSQDSGGMLSLLGTIDQCFKAGKKQSWHAASVTNICVGLLAGLKALLALRPQPLGSEILSLAQTIFLSILSEGDICPAQRRAASEGLGLLARLGNDIFTARLARLLLGDVTGTADSCFAGSIAFALGCIHRSAGGMALSSLVPSTVNCLSLLAKSSVAGLQVWSLHGLLSTIEAAGLSYVSQVQATLGLALDILLSEENAWVNLQQGVGRLINAIVAVLGPELAPGSIFFSRCKSVVAEISCQEEAATLLESVRFTQQLVLFAPQAVTVHSHVQTLLPTLSSGQPSLRHLAVSTLRHLIEKDSDSIIYEKIEDTLFHMLDEETDPEIGNLVRTTIKRLLYAASPKCLSHWLSILRAMVLATSSGRDIKTGDNRENDSVNGYDGETRSNFGDDENMVSGFNTSPSQASAYVSTSMNSRRDKHLRYRTRLFAAECLSLLPSAVGKGPAHFDLSLARNQCANEKISGDWLVLHVQELISLAYQISTIHFENMQPIGVGLLSTIMDKFESVPDPDLPGHLLLEQYQAQLVSAVRTALDASSGPILLEAGLQLATKILTYGILSGDQVAVRRIFSLISRPLNNFTDLYYPSFAEWVSCKIKIRLLAAHASLKCYTYAFLRKQHATESDEYLALLPLFSESSSILGTHWVSMLKDFTYICLRLHLKQNWKSFLEDIKSPLVSAKLQPCLQEVWPVIFQAVALDALPANFGSNTEQENLNTGIFISGYSMVQLKSEDFRFLWGFALFVLFQGEDASCNGRLIPLGSAKPKCGVGSPVGDASPQALNIYEIVLPVFQFLSAKRFFIMGFLTADICREMLQVFSYFICMDDTWDSLAISVLLQVVQNCPNDFFETDKFSSLVVELSLAYLLKLFRSTSSSSDNSEHENMISLSFTTAATVLERLRSEKHVNAILGFLLTGYRCLEAASTEVCISKSINLIQGIMPLLKTYLDDKFELHDDDICLFNTIVGACLSMVSNVTKECTESIYLSEQKRSDSSKLPKLKLAFALKEMFLLAKLACECLRETRENNSLFFTVIQHSTECIRTVLCNSNIQIQTIGFQVLKNMVQRSTNSGHNSFVLFITGELLEHIFTTIVAMLKSPVNREKVAIASECLRILVILQTLSKVHESRKSLMNLLLQAIVFIFSVPDDRSQGLDELRKTAGHLISQLAQIPSSVVFLKDALLAMPVENRLQLQGIIRASAPQEHTATETKSPTPSLVIKLPLQTEETRDQGLAKSIPAQNSDYRRVEENKKDEDEGEEKEGGGDDDDDDWDTFQSFPASTSEAVATANAGKDDVEEPEIIEKSSTSDIYAEKFDVEENDDSYTARNIEEDDDDADKKASAVGTASDAVDQRNQNEELHVEKFDVYGEKFDVEENDDSYTARNIEEDDDDADKKASAVGTASDAVDQRNQNEEPHVEKFDVYGEKFYVEENDDSYTARNIEEDDDDADKKASAVGTASNAVDQRNQNEEPHVSQDISEAEKSDGDHHQERVGVISSYDSETISDQQATEVEEKITEPCISNIEEAGQTSREIENEQSLDLQSHGIEETNTAEPYNDDYENSQEAVTGEIDLVLKHQSDDSIQQIETVGEGHQGTDEIVTSDNSIDIGLSNDAYQPNLVGDDEQQSQSTGTENISPESSGDLHAEATSDEERRRETDDIKRDSNTEQDEDQNKTNS